MPFTSTNQPHHHGRRPPELIAALRAEWDGIMTEARTRCVAETIYDPDELDTPSIRGLVLRQLGLPLVPHLAAKYGIPALTCRLILDGLIYRTSGGSGLGRPYPPEVRAALTAAVRARPETHESIHRIAARLAVTPGVVYRAIRADRASD